jgi:hypothetical protein
MNGATPIAVAAAGMQHAEQRFADSAGRVAGMSAGSGVDLAAESVAQIQATTEFRADLNVVKFADEVWRCLLGLQTR